MYKIDFKKPIHLHFIGIGGISMSGLAEILLQENFRISGSDAKSSELTEKLERLGAEISFGQRAGNITEGIGAVVYTAAIHPDNPELKAAVDRGIPTLTRAELLGQIMGNYGESIAISGTHGKTTTTSMVTQMLLGAGTDPTVSVGGILDSIGGNIRVGNSGFFLTEACEYTNSFLQFFPTVGVILNIEEDHMDFFKDIDDIRHSFQEFARKIPAHGTLIINADIDDYEEIVQDASCRVITYGLDHASADFTAQNITYDEKGHGSFDVIRNGKKGPRFHLKVVGRHNVSNTLSCLALAALYEIDDDTVQQALTAFHGTERRFEYKGEKNGITIIDDYAHHPTEISATLDAAVKYPHKDLWVIFQPHTYTRTKAFLKDFAASLSAADKIILTDIYAAREKDPGDISSAMLAEELKKLGKEVYYFSDFKEIEKFILKNLVNGDLLITMGAGNVVDIGEALLET